MPSERRELSEIITRYRVEPGLRGDIYVEGPSDKRLFRWIFSCFGSPDTIIYEVDTVNIPLPVLERHGLFQSSNRNRIIALAQELTENVPTVEDQAAFLIDRDFDDYFEISYSLPSIHRTDFTSSEMYLFEESIVRKFLSFAAKNTELDASDFMDNLSSELTKIFLVRLANASLGANLCSVQIFRSCSMAVDGRIRLDADDYLNRRLSSSGQLERLEEFKSEMESFEKKLPADPRFRMHGHDLVDILLWFLRNNPGRQTLRTKEALETALSMALDVNELAKKQQLASLLGWAGVDKIP